MGQKHYGNATLAFLRAHSHTCRSPGRPRPHAAGQFLPELGLGPVAGKRQLQSVGGAQSPSESLFLENLPSYRRRHCATG